MNKYKKRTKKRKTKVKKLKNTQKKKKNLGGNNIIRGKMEKNRLTGYSDNGPVRVVIYNLG